MSDDEQHREAAASQLGTREPLALATSELDSGRYLPGQTQEGGRTAKARDRAQIEFLRSEQDDQGEGERREQATPRAAPTRVCDGIGFARLATGNRAERERGPRSARGDCEPAPRREQEQKVRERSCVQASRDDDKEDGVEADSAEASRAELEPGTKQSFELGWDGHRADSDVVRGDFLCSIEHNRRVRSSPEGPTDRKRAWLAILLVSGLLAVGLYSR